MDEQARWAIGIAITLGIAMFGFLMRALGLKAGKESTDKRFEQIMAEMREDRKDLKDHTAEDRNMHKDVLAEIRETNRHLSMTNSTLANLLGRFEAQNGKHPQA